MDETDCCVDKASDGESIYIVDILATDSPSLALFCTAASCILFFYISVGVRLRSHSCRVCFLPLVHVPSALILLIIVVFMPRITGSCEGAAFQGLKRVEKLLKFVQPVNLNQKCEPQTCMRRERTITNHGSAFD